MTETCDLIGIGTRRLLRWNEVDRGTVMKQLLLDGAGWQTQDDVYDAFFRGCT